METNDCGAVSEDRLKMAMFFQEKAIDMVIITAIDVMCMCLTMQTQLQVV